MAKKRASKSGLTLQEIEEFKAALLAKRNEILSNIACMEDETLRRQISDLSRLPIHMADLGTDNYEIENTLGLVESERKLLSEINAALQRIEDGTYGICAGTGQPILKGRLEAIPWTRYCASYANLLEKGFVEKRYSFEESYHNGQTDEEQDEDYEESDEDELP